MQDQDKEIDELLENFDFKPITEGLGFHHSLKETKEIKTNLAEQKRALHKMILLLYNVEN
jgi:hypothetical protein